MVPKSVVFEPAAAETVNSGNVWGCNDWWRQRILIAGLFVSGPMDRQTEVSTLCSSAAAAEYTVLLNTLKRRSGVR